MAFWSSQTLVANLSRLVDAPDVSMVDCNAVTLRMGGEIYITPAPEQPDVMYHTKQILPPKGPFAIPPGQFAFLPTEEVVSIPDDVMGFISIKATLKLKGLVNVSGFHVDPGWCGPLIFSVFNAGPSPVHLQQGMPLFLLWIADLDSKSVQKKKGVMGKGIPLTVINGISGGVNSIYELGERTDKNLKTFEARIRKIETSQTRVNIYVGILGGVALVLLGAFAPSIYKWVAHSQTTVNTATSIPSSSTSLKTLPANTVKVDISKPSEAASTAHR
jgi:dCTP deaminase